MGRRSKLIDVPTAAALVSDGDLVAIGGIHAHAAPMPIIRELARAGRRNLRLLPNVSAGLPVEVLVAAGAVAEVYTAYVGMEDLGLAPAFRAAAEKGEIVVHDVDEPFTIYGLKAAAANLPFMPLPRGHEATSTRALSADLFRTVVDPYSGREHVAIPAMRPDVGIVHAPRCDRFGNVFLDGPVYQDDLILRASRTAIVVTDEIVPDGYAAAGRHKEVTVPSFMVSAVVALPFAAHPTSSAGHYGRDELTLEEYMRSPDDWMATYVQGPRDHHDYLERVGVKRLLGTLRVDPASTPEGTRHD
ncbi:CoA transferase subunit A [Kineosporiaceae bacterium SCSIO 59966]|nr:CoA transferase subunit A [Kineosporiaceae bacterium SCSIO 59966]